MGEGGWDWKTSKNFLQKCPKTFVRDCRLPESSGKVEELKQSQSVGTRIEIERVRNGVMSW